MALYQIMIETNEMFLDEYIVEGAEIFQSMEEAEDFAEAHYYYSKWWIEQVQ